LIEKSHSTDFVESIRASIAAYSGLHKTSIFFNQNRQWKVELEVCTSLSAPIQFCKKTSIKISRFGGADENLDLELSRKWSMYSHEDRLKTVKLYIKLDFIIADTIRELGCPSRNMLICCKVKIIIKSMYKQFDSVIPYLYERLKIAFVKSIISV
jgi:hypothetical protein